MSRVLIRKVFVVGLVLAVAGAVIFGVSAEEGFVATSHRYEAGLILAGLGAAITIVSWIMALVASALFRRWAWFIVVLVLGLIGLLLPIMVVYSAIGPNRRRDRGEAMGFDSPEAEEEGRRRLTPA